MCVYLGVIPVHSFTKHKPHSVPHGQFPSSRVFESSDTHVSLEVVGSHSTLNSGRAVKRKRCLCAAPRLHYSIGLGLHAVYLLIRPTVVLLSVKGFAQSVTVKGGLLLFLLPKLLYNSLNTVKLAVFHLKMSLSFIWIQVIAVKKKMLELWSSHEWCRFEFGLRHVLIYGSILMWKVFTISVH